MKHLIITLLFSAILAACTGSKPDPIPPGPTADAGSICEMACKNLRQLECEGVKDNCAETCTRTQEERLTDLHPQCLAGATSKESVRKCGSVRCK
jgi:hypothetical protein